MSDDEIAISPGRVAVPVVESTSAAPATNPEYQEDDLEAPSAVIDGTSVINADTFFQSNDPESQPPNHDGAHNDEDEDDAPNDTFGALKGCWRDGHVWHGILYLRNIIYLVAWLAFFSTISLGWALIVWLVMFGLFMKEFFYSSTAKYLRNVIVTEDIMDFMQRLYNTPPTIELHIECYHYESRTATYPDSDGYSRTRTDTSKVVTHVRAEGLKILHYQDESHELKEEDVRAYQLTKVKIHKTFTTPDDMCKRQCDEFIRRNNRDQCYNFSINYEIAGYKSRVLAYVDLEERPVFLNFWWCLVAHLTLFPALPYHIWMSSITGKTETMVQKKIWTCLRVPEEERGGSAAVGAAAAVLALI